MTRHSTRGFEPDNTPAPLPVADGNLAQLAELAAAKCSAACPMRSWIEKIEASVNENREKVTAMQMETAERRGEAKQAARTMALVTALIVALLQLGGILFNRLWPPSAHGAQVTQVQK